MTLLVPDPDVRATPAVDAQTLCATVLTVSLTEALLGRDDDTRFALTTAFARRFERLVRSGSGRVTAVVDDLLTAVFPSGDAAVAIAVGRDLVEGPDPRPAVGISTQRVGVVGGVGMVGAAPARSLRLAAVAPVGSVLADADTLVAAGDELGGPDHVHILRAPGSASTVLYQVVAGHGVDDVARCGGAADQGRWELSRVVRWDPERTRGALRTDAGEQLYFDVRHVVRPAVVGGRQRAFVVARPPLADGRNRVADPVVVVGQPVEVVVEDNHGGFGFGGLVTGPVDTPPITLVDLGSHEPGTTVTATVTAHRHGPVARVEAS